MRPFTFCPLVPRRLTPGHRFSETVSLVGALGDPTTSCSSFQRGDCSTHCRYYSVAHVWQVQPHEATAARVIGRLSVHN